MPSRLQLDAVSGLRLACVLLTGTIAAVAVEAQQSKVEPAAEIWRQALLEYRPGTDDLFAIYPGGGVLPPGLEVVSGTVESAEREDCAVNPPVRILTDGTEQTIEDGNSILHRPSGGAGLAVLGVEVESEGSAAPGTPKGEFIVIDEVEIGVDGSVASRGQAEKIYDLVAGPERVTLSGREGEFAVCREPDRQPDERAVAMVRGQTARPSVWLARLRRDHLLTTVGLDGDKGYTSSALANAYYDFRQSTDLGTSRLAMGDLARATPVWRARFTAAKNAWAQCTPVGVGHLTLDCGGARVTLDSLQAAAAPLSIFDTRRYLRLWIDTVPSGASIYLGAARQSPVTNTKLDIVSGRVREMRLEKEGFKPCPYGPRWVFVPVKGPRPGMRVTCTLVPRS